MPAPRVAALLITAVAGTCVTLAGCGGGASSSSSGSLPTAVPTAVVTSVPPAPLSSVLKLTGNFCADFRNLGRNISVPANAQGSLSAFKKHGTVYLNQVAAYFNGLAAEAPPQAGKELRIIAADYTAMASSIASGNLASLSKIERQMASFASTGTSGAAFRQLVDYMVRNCA